MTRDAVMMILVIGLAAAMRLSTRLADVQLQKQKLIPRRTPWSWTACAGS